MAQRVKHLPTMWVRSLGREDPLEKAMATHSSTLAWKILWTEKPGRLQSMGLQSRTLLSDFTFTFTFIDYVYTLFIGSYREGFMKEVELALILKDKNLNTESLRKISSLRRH